MGWDMRGISLIIAAALLSAGGASAQTLCDDANTACAGRIDQACLTRGRVGAGPVGLTDVAAKDDCAAQFASYRQCLSEVATECDQGRKAASNCASEDARQMWSDISGSEDVDALRFFIETCPNAPQAGLARLKLERLQVVATPAPEPAPDPVAAPVAEPPAPPPAAFPREADYRAAQTELRRLRLYSSGIDGDWGPGSQRAMTAFQRQAGIAPADGALTELSLAALRLAPTPPEPEPTRPAATQPTPPPAATSAARAHGDVFKDCPKCPEMIALRGGSFMMGSPPGEGLEREHPQHRVAITAFAIGKYEVTFDQWDACVAAGGCSHRPGDQGWGRGARPVINVSWNDAQDYVKWLSATTGHTYRLPSEAEWEYAARAGTTTEYSWGDTFDSARASTGSKNEPVGRYPANPWGLHDVHGNVWEWVQDCWHDSYRGAPTDGSAWMNANSGDCSRAVVRGGSWSDLPDWLRSANRNWYFRDGRSFNSGFRVSRTLPAR